MRFNFRSIISVLPLLVVALMWGCEPNPYKPSANQPLVENGVPLTIVADSVVNGQILLRFYVADYLFDTAETSTALRGFADWNSGVSGIQSNGSWFYWLQAGPGVYKFNFWGSIHWADTSKLKNSQWWFPELGDCAVKITKDFRVMKPSVGEVLLAGSTPSTSTSSVTLDTINQTIVIQMNGVSGSVLDTVFVSASKGTIVLLGDSIVYRRDPSKASLGYDTIKIVSPGVVTGAVNYDAIVKYVSSQAGYNAQGVKGYKVTMTFDPALIRTVPNGQPFAIGFPSWTKSLLGAKSNDRYPFMTGFMVPGRYNFDAGGDSAAGSWADSTVLDKSIWGLKTKTGYIMQGVLMPDGRWLPGSLVDSIMVPAVHDTICKTVHDTTSIPGKDIIDSIKIVIGGDSIHSYDTLILAGDLVKVVSSAAVSGGYNFSLLFSQAMVRTVPNGRPFSIGLPNWNVASSLGSKGTGVYYPFSVTLAPATYAFDVGGDSVSSWADSSVLKGTVWGYMSSPRHWILRVTVTNAGQFVPTSIVPAADTVKPPADTVKVKTPPDTVFVKTAAIPDTVIIQGQTRIIHDTITFDKVKIDSVIRFVDSAHHYDTITIKDLGVTPVNTAGIEFDTAWMDPGELLKGIATVDSFYRQLNIHTIETIDAQHNATFERDTARSTKLIQLGLDTFDLVLQFVSATPGTGDTSNVNFTLTTKAFSSGTASINALGLVPENWNQKTPSTGTSGGNFSFSAKMVSGEKYLLNFVDGGGAWAQQSIMKISKFVYVNGSNVDLAVALNPTATGFVYAPPAAP